MNDFLFWAGVALLLVGMLVFFAGNFWLYGAELLRFFFKLNVAPDIRNVGGVGRGCDVPCRIRTLLSGSELTV